MTSTVRELKLLSPLLALLSILPASRRLHRAAVLDIFHLITGLFLTIYASHIPCHFHCVSHSTPTWFLFDFLFHFHHSLWSSTLQHPQSVPLYKNRNNFENMMGCMVVVISTSHRGSPGLIPWSSQYIAQYFHSFTTLLASIFSSALST